MARIRSIKPGFFTNLELADCSRDARLLFIGLWAFADREGRLKDQARRIKIEVFPYDEIDVAPLLTELQKAKFIIRYQIADASFIQIVNFTKHQRPHKKEAASEIPAPDGYTPEPGPDTPDEEAEEDLKRDKAAPSREITGQAVKLPGKPEKGSDEQVGDGEWIMENGINGGGDGNGRDAPPVINPLLQAFADVCRKSLDRLNEFQTRKMGEALEDLRALTEQPDEVLAPRVRRFGEWFKTRNFKDPTPSFSQIPGDWGKFEAAEKAQKPAKPKNPISTVPEAERERVKQRRLERDTKLIQQQKAS